jgi:hypothetical protein
LASGPDDDSDGILRHADNAIADVHPTKNKFNISTTYQIIKLKKYAFALKCDASGAVEPLINRYF